VDDLLATFDAKVAAGERIASRVEGRGL